MHRLILTYLKAACLILLTFVINTGLSGQEKQQEAENQKTEKEKPQKLKSDPDTALLFFLFRGPDVQGNLDYALLNASAEGKVLAIEWLIKNGADVNTGSYENVTPLFLAVASNKAEAVKILLENNADPNVVSDYGETPLIVAVKNQNLEIAEHLVRDSADINFTDKYGATPLHYASVYGFFYIADMLIYYEAGIFKRDKDGTTPLMAAIWGGHADLADLLMQNGADPSEKDNAGFSPFLIAAQNGDTVIMNLLRKRMVNIYDANIYGYNALDLCIKANHVEAIRYLLRIGDKWSDEGSGSVNPYSVATIYRRKELSTLLKENNIPEIERPGIDQLSVSASLKHCFYDYMTGVSVMAKEPVFNLGFIAGLDFKPFYTRVVIKETEDIFYQYRDKSALIYAGIYKEIPLTDYPLKGNWWFTGSLSVAYAFGNKLRGTSIAPGNEFKLNPAAGFRWAKNSFAIILNLEYLDTDFYRVGPVWLRVGFSHTIFFNQVRAPGKVIKWY